MQALTPQQKAEIDMERSKERGYRGMRPREDFFGSGTYI